MKRKSTAPTMKDVAQEAGVALGTVSKVFNNIPVGEEYRVKVEKAAAKLGYQINNYARSLKTNKTHTIALIIPNLTHAFYASVADAVCRELMPRGYHTLIATTEYDEKAEQDCITLVQQNKVDGIIGLTYNPNLIVDPNLPFVTIDRYFSPSVPCVASDNFGGGELAAKKLVEFGAKKLVCFHTSSHTPGEADKRLSGFISYCTLNRIDFDTLHVFTDRHDPAFDEYIDSHMENGKCTFDGIFCGTDLLAYEMIHKLRARGIRIPEDVQIIGYDGLKKFGFTDYYCSTIVQPVDLIARNAVGILLSKDRNAQPALVSLPVTYADGGTTKE